MPRARLWIIGGPNGAGKTTLSSHPRFRSLLWGIRFLNPNQVAIEKLRAAGRQGFRDAAAEELRRCFVEAAEAVEQQLREAVVRREPIAVESVLSTRKYCAIVEQVLAAGGFFGLIYVAVRSAELSRERVARRAAQGGHDVPMERLEERWSRSAKSLGWFAKRATRFWVVDNSDCTPGVPPRLIAEGGHGRISVLDADAIPGLTVCLTREA